MKKKQKKAGNGRQDISPIGQQLKDQIHGLTAAFYGLDKNEKR